MDSKGQYIFISLLIIALGVTQAAGRHVHAATEEHGDQSHEEHDENDSHKESDHEDSQHDHGNDDERFKRGKHEGHKHEEVEQKEEGHGDHGDKHDEHGEHEEGVVSLDEESRSMIQLKTEKVIRKKLGGHLKVFGKIAKDTENYSYITFKEEGEIESIEVDLGALVNKGDPLLTVRKSDGSIEAIKSEIHGAVLSIFVKPGDRVDSLTSLLSIIDVDTLRATIDVYERDLQLLRIGQKVVFTTTAFPNKTFHGKVVYISPTVDEHTQAINVRVDVDNPEHLLRLGMFVSGELIYASDNDVLAIPASAIQQLNNEDIVFVTEEGDNLKLKEVILGQKSNGFVEIKDGLTEGEIVVTEGSFYLKSEQAKEAFGDGHNH